MTTQDELMREFVSKAYDTYALRGQTFTIVEDLPRGKPLREIEEINENFAAKDPSYLLAIKTGARKKDHYFLIGIETGIIQKDLKLRRNELIQFMLSCPKNTPNLQGITASVDQTKVLHFVSQAMQPAPISSITQAMGANTPTPQQTTPITQPEQPKVDYKDEAVAKLAANIKEYEDHGVAVGTEMVLYLASKHMPTDALNLVGFAKNKGMISEKDGKWKVN